jgi:hypothetical protein
VFLGVTELVQGPEGVIPSFVCILPPEQRDDFRGAIFADLPAVNVVVESGSVISERKISSFGVGFPACDSGRVSGLIENGAEIVGNIKQNAGEQLRKFLHEFDLVKMLPRFRVLLNEMGPWVAADKFINEHIEIVDVLLCANERQSRTVEQVRHGKQTIMTDWRPNQACRQLKRAAY